MPGRGSTTSPPALSALGWVPPAWRDRWGFVTRRQAATTIMPNRRVDRMVTTGAFGFRRNPIYMGEVLILLGLAELTHNIWFAIAAPLFAIAIQVLAIRPEERHLEERFGQAYLDYKERTRRWF